MQPSQFLKALQALQLDDLTKVKGIGVILAQNILDFNSSERAKKLIQQFEILETSGKAPELLVPATITQEKQKTVCITGSFDIPRDQIKELLKNGNYRVVDSVSKSTDILLMGENAGSKGIKAEKLGLQIITDYHLL